MSIARRVINRDYEYDIRKVEKEKIVEWIYSKRKREYEHYKDLSDFKELSYLKQSELASLFSKEFKEEHGLHYNDGNTFKNIDGLNICNLLIFLICIDNMVLSVNDIIKLFQMESEVIIEIAKEIIDEIREIDV